MTASAPPDPHAANRRVTRLSIGVAVVLVVLKAFALGASGAVSMLASLADSALDLAASVGTFLAVRWAAAPPDDDHRYGHGKAEALAALVQAGLIFASSLFIAWEALVRLRDPQPLAWGGLATAVMIVSMILTGWLIREQGRAAAVSGSLAVKADRAHYASDLAANLVVLIGLIGGAFLGAPGLDAVAGLLVAVWLFWGALGVLREAADHLLDRAAPDADLKAVVAAVTADPAIRGVHRLRAHRSGSTLIAQMHVDLDAGLTLIQAHQLIDAAERRVREVFPGADVLIHPDPLAPGPRAGPWETPQP